LHHLSLLTGTAAAPLAQGAGVDVSIWRVVISLLFCLALAAGAIFALRHRLPFTRGAGALWRTPENRRLQIVEQLVIGQQKSICLIVIDGNEYLAAFAPNAVSLTPIASNTDGAK
jgi:flagellar biogenesis protein FliO